MVDVVKRSADKLFDSFVEAFNLGSVTGFYGVNNAMFDVVFQDDSPDGFNCGVDG